MASGNPTIGRNGSAVIVVNGSRIDFSKITQIMARPRYNTVSSNPLNSPPVENYLPNGWDLTFNVDRYSSAGDDLATTLDNAFWSNQTIASGTIYITVNNPDGSVTEHEYQNCSFRFTSTGTYSGDAVVNYTVAAFAAQRNNLNG